MLSSTCVPSLPRTLACQLARLLTPFPPRVLLIHQAGYDRSIVVPKPYPEWCTQEVLVMEFVPGVKLTDVVRHRPKQLAKAGGGESWWARTIGGYFTRRCAGLVVI